MISIQLYDFSATRMKKYFGQLKHKVTPYLFLQIHPKSPRPRRRNLQHWTVNRNRQIGQRTRF